MAYTCGLHQWRHGQIPCPKCQELIGILHSQPSPTPAGGPADILTHADKVAERVRGGGPTVERLYCRMCGGHVLSVNEAGVCISCVEWQKPEKRAEIIAHMTRLDGDSHPPAEPEKCPTCGSDNLQSRKCAVCRYDFFGCTSHGDFVKCTDPWHESQPPHPAPCFMERPRDPGKPSQVLTALREMKECTDIRCPHDGYDHSHPVEQPAPAVQPIQAISGLCFAHGPYEGQGCPKWPACVTDPQISKSSGTVSSGASRVEKGTQRDEL